MWCSSRWNPFFLLKVHAVFWRKGLGFFRPPSVSVVASLSRQKTQSWFNSPIACVLTMLHTLPENQPPPPTTPTEINTIAKKKRLSLDPVHHRLNMELDLQSLFRLHVHSCIHWLWPRNLPPPRNWAHILGRYRSAKKDNISLWPPAVPIRELNVPPNAFFFVHIMDSGIPLPTKCGSGESVWYPPPRFFTLYFCPLSTLLDTPTTLYLHRLNDAVRLSAWLGWKQTVTCLVAEKPVI